MMDKSKDRWYFKTYVLVIAFLCVGPLALPLVWFNPRFSNLMKLVLSAIIVILSYLLWVLFVNSTKPLVEYYKELLGTMK